MAADLDKLRAEFQNSFSQAQGILERYPQGTAIPQEEALQFKRLKAAATDAQNQIKAVEAEVVERKDLADMASWFESGTYRHPMGDLQPDAKPDEIKTAVLKSGWEIKADGMVYAPTSFRGGTLVPMYAEEVLFGDAGDDVTAARYFKQSRMALSPLYRKAYTNLLRQAKYANSESSMMMRLSDLERKALSEGTDEGGGFTVPPDLQAEILVRLPQKSVMRGHAMIRNTSRDEIKFPAIKPNPNNTSGTPPDGSIYTSGFVGDWAGETPAFSQTDPGFQQFPISVKKIRCATLLSNDLIADSVANILAFLSQDGATNMGLVEDKGFIRGIGSALQPLGLLNVPGITAIDVEGSTANTISNTSAAQGSAPKIVNLAYALPPQYLSGATWLMQRAVEGKVRNLVDGVNRPIWPAYTASGLAAASPRELVGYPVENTPFMDQDGTDGLHPFVFGDLSQYVIVQRAQITTVILRERFADTDQTGIILFERVGGALWNTDALRTGVV